MSQWIVAASLVALAALHSSLGERHLLQPLFAQMPALAVGRGFARRTLRFAWHLTSVLWLALAALALRADRTDEVIIGAAMALSAAMALVGSRGRHFAWALFFAAAVASLVGRGAASGAAVASVVAAMVLGAVALLHFVWALGVRWGIDVASPTVEGRRAFAPPRWLTALVALGLAAGAALAWRAGSGARRWELALCALGAAVFALRPIGDFRTAGLFKRVYGTPFARWDDMLFTPLCAVLAACFALLSAGGAS
jgi:hypothetical protein